MRVTLEGREVLSVDHREVQIMEAAPFDGALLAHVEHVWVDVGHRDVYREHYNQKSS